MSLVTNEPENSETELTITGEAIRTLQLSPNIIEVASFGEDNESVDITITSLDNTAFSIEAFEATSQCITADVGAIWA